MEAPRGFHPFLAHFWWLGTRQQPTLPRKRTTHTAVCCAMFDAAFTRHAENGRVSVARLLPLLRDLSEPAGSTPASSAVLACAIAHVSDGRPAVAILRTASDARAADRPVSLMQHVFFS